MHDDPMAMLRDDLARAKGYWPKLSEQTGVDHSTIARIARGDTPNPQVDTFHRIRGWLDANLPLIAALSVSDPQHVADSPKPHIRATYSQPQLGGPGGKRQMKC